MPKSTSINKLIEKQYASLSPNARNIANFIQQNPLAVITMSVADIAAASKTSKATVSRFFRQLGYESHQDAKSTMLQKRDKGFPVAQAGNKNDSFSQEIANLESSFQGLSDNEIDDVARKISSAKRVIIFGYRNSYPMAINFRQQLKQLRENVFLLPQPGQTISEDVVGFTNDDFIILLGFRRRPRIFPKLVEQLNGKTTLLLADPSGQVFNQQVSHLFVCQLGQSQPFDSYAAPMAVISLICNRVFKYCAGEGQQRAAAISDLYNEFDELS
ncbi:MurR/RpiR family transcriptional regulator [Agaribacter marinus]|uniref:RpiR family transcriptional regulator n=1 Tax=Agaribacter marinus TaxID=1431249 RepID=A0AA37SV54_9ALTE|nr:MurR/RpiR family transcriptional regulator [Agaribacter marinus]GLR69852.1 RpiR family transcriptional regulator [Agaribacter marinus]